MASFRCMLCASTPTVSTGSLFKVIDTRGRPWICALEPQDEELAANLGTSEWAWGYHYLGIVRQFMPYYPGELDEGDEYDNAGRVLERLVTLRAAGADALAAALAEK